MSEVTPRFEFRAFAQSFGRVEENIRALSDPPNINESSEIYLIAADAQNSNIKVRDGCLEIKELVDRRASLERWKPTGKAEFPVTRDFVKAHLLPGIPLELHRSTYSWIQFSEEVMLTSPSLRAAHVFKRRFRFVVDGCSTEVDELLVNGAAIRSAAVESEDADAVLAVMERVGLADYENVNYPRAIRRIMGLEQWPQGG